MSIAIATASAVATGATTKTLLTVIAPAAHRLNIKEWGISFDGVDAAAVPIRVQLIRFGTDGTGTTVTPVKSDQADPTIVATSKHTYTAEPTGGGDILGQWYLTPAGGLFVMQYPLGDEIVVGVSGILAIRTIAAVSVNASVYIKFEE